MSYHSGPDGEVAAWDLPPHRASLYLNFGGGKLTKGTNASEFEADCLVGAPIEYPAFAGTEQEKLALVQRVKEAMAPFGVRILYEQAPPKHLPHGMLMIGGNGFDEGFGGPSVTKPSNTVPIRYYWVNWEKSTARGPGWDIIARRVRGRGGGAACDHGRQQSECAWTRDLDRCLHRGP